jgi:hypothetical protein
MNVALLVSVGALGVAVLGTVWSIIRDRRAADDADQDRGQLGLIALNGQLLDEKKILLDRNEHLEQSHHELKGQFDEFKQRARQDRQDTQERLEACLRNEAQTQLLYTQTQEKLAMVRSELEALKPERRAWPGSS